VRLDEIVNPQIKTNKPISKSLRGQLSDRDDLHRRSNNRDNATLKYKGGGVYAHVYAHKKRPGSVLKVGKYSTRLPEEDAYLGYINLLANNDRMASNPYFPRVYDVKIYPYESEYARTKEWTGEYVVEMEELQSIEDLSVEEVNMLGNRMFKYWKQRGSEIAHDMFSYLPSNMQIPAALIAMIREAVNQYSSTDFEYQIKDKKLTEAVMLLRELISKGYIEEDLHINNVMIRRTSVGPQLVITDPVKTQ
jgi:hypothetical protein